VVFAKIRLHRCACAIACATGTVAAAAWLASARAAPAGEADVVGATADCDAKNVCRFTVTLRHADTGWDHYADRWQVLSESGDVLATRVLQHPHVDEQPFTRTLAGVALPAEVRRVRIRAHDSVHGEGGAEVVVDLPRGG
jgi:hypothetical protein